MTESQIVRYIGAVARKHRREQELKLVRVGASVDRGEQTVSKFEKGKNWVGLDDMVTRYAEVLELDPREMWREALEMWEAETE